MHFEAEDRVDAKLTGHLSTVLEWTRGRDKRRCSTARMSELSGSVVAGAGVETQESADDLTVGLDSAGDVVGFDICQATRRLDLSTPEIEALPVLKTRVG